MGGLFLSQQHPASRRTATAEDDGTSAWLYLSEPGGPRVVADAWAYNRVPPPPRDRVASYRPAPPPAAEGFAGPDALCPDPAAHIWSLLWSADGNSAALVRDGVPLALIARAGRPGYCRLLACPGPWGAPWDEAAFQAAFAPDAEPGAAADPAS